MPRRRQERRGLGGARWERWFIYLFYEESLCETVLQIVSRSGNGKINDGDGGRDCIETRRVVGDFSFDRGDWEVIRNWGRFAVTWWLRMFDYIVSLQRSRNKVFFK